MEKIIAFSDGGARGNPGPAGGAMLTYLEAGTLPIIDVVHNK